MKRRVFRTKEVQMETLNEVKGVVQESARGGKTPKVKMRRPPGPVEKLKAERVQEALRTMPGWVLAADAGSISRVRDFGSKQLAAAYAGFVMSCAGLAKRSVEVSLSHNLVGITIPGLPLADGSRDLTPGTLDFARRLG
jgi:pterin-4a-carbinolamine dehydratase